MSLEQQVTALVASANALTGAVNSKIGQIDQKVNAAVSAVPQAIKDNFTKRMVAIDPINGDDTLPNGPFKTIGAAVSSVPDGGIIQINFPYGAADKIFEFSQAVNIGSRVVILSGGYNAMENQGMKSAVIKAIAGFDPVLNRTYFRGAFSGDPAGRLYFSFIRLQLPRIAAGSTIEHSNAGSFISGGLTVTTHHYALTGPHIYYEDGVTNPMLLMRSSARDGKANLQDFTVSYTHIQTVLGQPIIELQYSTGTMRFAYYGGTVSDKDGAVVTYRELFSGLSYGDHGYATNLVAAQSVLKQAV